MNRLKHAWAAFTRAEYPASEALFERILADAPDEESKRQAQFGLGYVLAFTDRFDYARSMFMSLAEEAKGRGALEEHHRALHQVGMVERMAGNWTQAQRVFADEARLIEHLGSPPLSVAVNAYEQGIVALQLNEFKQAQQWLERSLEQASQTDDQVAVACAHRGLGDYFEHQGKVQEARQAWERAVSAFTQSREWKAVDEVQDRLQKLAE